MAIKKFICYTVRVKRKQKYFVTENDAADENNTAEP